MTLHAAIQAFGIPAVFAWFIDLCVDLLGCATFIVLFPAAAAGDISFSLIAYFLEETLAREYSRRVSVLAFCVFCSWVLYVWFTQPLEAADFDWPLLRLDICVGGSVLDLVLACVQAFRLIIQCSARLSYLGASSWFILFHNAPILVSIWHVSALVAWSRDF